MFLFLFTRISFKDFLRSGAKLPYLPICTLCSFPPPSHILSFHMRMFHSTLPRVFSAGSEPLQLCTSEKALFALFETMPSFTAVAQSAVSRGVDHTRPHHTCTQVFRAASLTAATTQPHCPSAVTTQANLGLRQWSVLRQ